MRILIASIATLLALNFTGAEARTLLEAPDCSRDKGSLPRPELSPGTPDRSNPIEHVIIIMQENHSFDNYFGKLNEPGFYGDQVDGLKEGMGAPDAKGNLVPVHHEKLYCPRDPDHSWTAMHQDWNHGANNGFYLVNNQQGKKGIGADPLGFYTEKDLPFYYGLANEFAISDRYFSSVLGPTWPNRFYLMAATSFGHIANDWPPAGGYAQDNVFDLLTNHGVSWKYFYTDWSYIWLFKTGKFNVHPIKRFSEDLEAGTLPEVVFLEMSGLEGDEHPSHNMQFGQSAVAKFIRKFIDSGYWRNSVVFLTYDEGGGFYDHVAPPNACHPDGIAPILKPGDNFPADFDRYGFRVPFVAISPYAKRHHVSHDVYDHTSVLRFIEDKFNLPALTRRDANADPFRDVFDFEKPNFVRPSLPKARVNFWKTLSCFARGRIFGKTAANGGGGPSLEP